MSLAVHCGAVGGAVVAGIGFVAVTPRPSARVEIRTDPGASAPPAPPVEAPPVVVEPVAADVEFSEPSFEPEPLPWAPVPAASAPAFEPTREPAVPEPVWCQRWARSEPAPTVVVPKAIPTESRPPVSPPALESAFVEASQLADNVPPQYPLHDRALGHEGTVVVLVQIDVGGVVSAAALATPSPFPGLNRAALQAVRSWRFRPAQKAGLAVASRLEVPIVFQLTER